MSDDEHLFTVIEAVSKLTMNIHLQNRRIAQDYGVSGLELSALRWVAAGPPATLDELAQRSKIPLFTLGEMIERLAHLEFVTIESTPEYPRENPWPRIRITVKGIEFLDEAPVLVEEQVAQKLFDLETDERKLLVDAVQLLSDLVSPQLHFLELESARFIRRGRS